MAMIIEAIYQDGVLKPLEKIALHENERVRIQIEREPFVTKKKGNFISLRGIWKDKALLEDKEDWVSETIAEIRRESTQKIDRLAQELNEALGDG